MTMMSDVRFVDTWDQYRDARRVLMALGFRERSACSAHQYESCVLVAPDGYELRLAFNGAAQPESEG